ncbi:hypothetical protein Paride_0117 [Pseudomonas phage Paride]|nr:hypothetical protein Paride_0117 [Pseudomonas phage Paride]
MGIKRWIEVPFQKEGIHMYPGADSNPALATNDWKDVSFLGYPHFHYFYFTVKIEVFHNERDIEFIQFRRFLERLYSESLLKLDGKSCETMAEELYEQINIVYPSRDVVITVAEDNINKAVLEFFK